MRTNEISGKRTAGNDENVLDYLAEQGYDPDDSGDWADLVVSGIGSVRVAWDDGELAVYLSDAGQIEIWSVKRISAPAAVALAIIAQAENELADWRGGPVVARQMTRADGAQLRRGIGRGLAH